MALEQFIEIPGIVGEASAPDVRGAIPVLSHLLDTPRAHPEEAYLVLASLIGQLSSFSADADPRNVWRFS